MSAVRHAFCNSPPVITPSSKTYDDLDVPAVHGKTVPITTSVKVPVSSDAPLISSTISTSRETYSRVSRANINSDSLHITNFSYHKPLVAQRSSPSLHKSSLKNHSSNNQSKSRHGLSVRKFSYPKITRLVSPQSNKFNHQYSRVPKSDSAYSEEPYSYSPSSRGYSPTDSPYGYSYLPSSDEPYIGFRYPSACGIPRSDSAYSDQCAVSSPFRSSSSVPKSHSTILRSDSAFSDIEYSYSTIPPSDSCHFENEFSCTSLPKSESTYSESILVAHNNDCGAVLPRSFSAYSHQVSSLNDTNDHFSDKENGHRQLSRTEDNSSPLRDTLVHSTCTAESPSTTTQLVTTNSDNSCTSSSSDLIMPTFKSLIKPPNLGINSNSNKQERSRKVSDISVHSLRLIGKSSSPEPQIKKSQTVLALTSQCAALGSGTASTKLLTKDNSSSDQCFINNCIGKTLKHSISQTLNQSIGHSLNLLGGTETAAQKRKNRRKSHLSAILPSTLSLSPSKAPSSLSIAGKSSSSLGADEENICCRLCLMDVPVHFMCQLSVCNCRFCEECMIQYCRLKVQEGEYRIECPDASCAADTSGPGELTADEIEAFVGPSLFAVRNKHKLDAEVRNDPYRSWCPKPGCETIVHLNSSKFLLANQKSSSSTHSNEPSTSAVPRTIKLPSPPVNILGSTNSSLIPHRQLLSDVTVENTEEMDRGIEITIRPKASSLQHRDSTDTSVSSVTDQQQQPPRATVDSTTQAPIKPSHLNIKPLTVSSDAGQSSAPPPQQPHVPDESIILASLAGLQSPADYRSFAASVIPPPAELSSSNPLTALQSPADYRPPPQIDVYSATCTTCGTIFCPLCRQTSHPGQQCHAPAEPVRRKKYKNLIASSGMVANDFQGIIKMCPNPSCQVSIERNEGCAQMQCRACKHTFCWYCLASLEEDFLLRHYDKGPCRNMLGHSRASVLCHRLQVMAIFLGVGLLLFAASPLLVFVGPCMLCCKCKICYKAEDPK